jgi:hypothetical protein
MAPVKEFCIKNQHSLKIDKIDLKTQEICRFILQKGCNSGRKKKAVLKVPPDKKTSWGKRERYSFGYAVFLILALMK